MVRTKRSFKDAVYGQLARAGKALSSPKRLELLDLLSQSPRTVEALAKEASTTVANASQHLQVLHAGGLVEAEKQGRFVCYRLADESVGRFLRTFRLLAEDRLAELERMKQRFFAGFGGAEAVDEATLLDRARQGQAIVLDVRPNSEYHSAHLEGAISIPLEELENRLSELPRDTDVVAYCRGPYCVLAAEAVRLLRGHGFAAHRLEASVYDWEARGLRVVRGAGRNALPSAPGNC
ncbi:MAG TPA: metalloregulator ArsR/SmtB family transcription factor [Terriglobia bacterium]|nr:metalloregulator ArsR/SmtB family transcription factor [Terriglobia bacterium]